MLQRLGGVEYSLTLLVKGEQHAASEECSNLHGKQLLQLGMDLPANQHLQLHVKQLSAKWQQLPQALLLFASATM